MSKFSKRELKRKVRELRLRQERYKQAIQELQEKEQRVEEKIIELYHQAGIDSNHPKGCDHSVTDRTSGGAYICSVCDKMIGMD